MRQNAENYKGAFRNLKVKNRVNYKLNENLQVEPNLTVNEKQLEETK